MIRLEDFQDIPAKLTPQYVAGLFDGEGCVFGDIKKADIAQIKVSITQKDPIILNFISAKIPGGIVKQINRSTGHSYYELVYVSLNCAPLLTYIKDYVIIKKTQVDLALEFCIYYGYVGKFVPEGHKAKRLEIVEKLKQEKLV